MLYVYNFGIHNKIVCVLVWLVSRVLLFVIPLDPGFSVHGISQATILEWVTIYFSKAPSQPRDWTHDSCVSCMLVGSLPAELSRKPNKILYLGNNQQWLTKH